MPHMKTLGIIYTSSDDSAVAQYKMFVKICKQENVRLKAYSIANTNDLTQVAEQAVRSVDAIYVPTDNTIAGAMQTLVGAANNAKVPVFLPLTPWLNKVVLQRTELTNTNWELQLVR